MVVVQGILALIGAILLGISAFKDDPKPPSLWRLGWALVVLAVTLTLIRAGLKSL